RQQAHVDEGPCLRRPPCATHRAHAVLGRRPLRREPVLDHLTLRPLEKRQCVAGPATHGNVRELSTTIAATISPSIRYLALLHSAVLPLTPIRLFGGMVTH